MTNKHRANEFNALHPATAGLGRAYRKGEHADHNQCIRAEVMLTLQPRYVSIRREEEL